MKWAALLIVALAACADMPRDPESTTDRVRAEGAFRVGLIADAPGGRAREAALLARLAASVPARPRVEPGAAEPLLARLEKRELDMVVGRMDGKSPWEKRVHIVPLQRTERKRGTPLIVAALPPGENAWAMLVEQHAHALEER